MLEHELLTETGILIVRPKGPLAAREINPTFSLAVASYGTACAWAGQSEDAIQFSEQALSARPRETPIIMGQAARLARVKATAKRSHGEAA